MGRPTGNPSESIARKDSTNPRKGPIAFDGDAQALGQALRDVVRGEVRFDKQSRALYSTDSSNYRQVPIGVVLPKDPEDVIAAIAVCRRFGAPILSRGGGTSLAGQCCNVAVIIDMSRSVDRILSIDRERRIAVVQPGVILDDLRSAASAHGLTFGPDPATHASCTLGGMIGNDSCGVHSVMAAFEGEGARTADQIVQLEVVTYDGVRMRVGETPGGELARIIAEGGRRGQIYSDLKKLVELYAPRIRAKYPDIPRRVSGYSLPYLLPEKGFHVARALAGSEGTCITVLEATLRLIANPRARSLLVIGFVDVSTAADHVPQILEQRPIGLEGIDERLVEDTKAIGLYPKEGGLLPDGHGWLLIEFGGDSKEDSDSKAQRLMEKLRGRDILGMKLYDDHRQERVVWKVRESALGATAHVPGKSLMWEGWEDSAVSPEKLGDYMRDLRRLLERYRYEGDFYGHFGQGCLHNRINFDLETKEGIGTFHAFLEDAADLVVSYGGSLSGEHGDGQSRGELLPRMFGPELIEAFREFKRIWDPEGKMNPGKLIDANPIVEDLRLGTGYIPAPVETHFRYPEDKGILARAALRCVGVGQCRRLSGGTMCPSYMVTREEVHSTRGRARLLFEMLRGEVLKDGWRSREVREALDLCLACKGCKRDCPTQVDMATYKAEFLAHHYAGRRRPASAYSMGLIHQWAPLASAAPGLANFLTQTPGVARLVKAFGGVSPRRRMPAFARQTFRRWFRGRRGGSSRGAGARGRVLLWPDTFCDHFYPATGRAAVEVLEAAGFSVDLPETRLCCGRPLYDFGMLDTARRLLRRTLRSLTRELRQGTPIVFLEPSCAAVFRDELVGLFPDDEDARRLKQHTFLLSEILETRAADWSAGRLSGSAILQVHCHHKSIFGSEAEEKWLEKLGLRVLQPNDTCCGMAGAFGFERQHFEISRQIGERSLFPAVRAAAPDVFVIADGFSCREQIRQGADREALHFAEVLRLALSAAD